MACRSRQALMQGLRPHNGQQQNTNTPTHGSFCVCRCIYCDVWKLATLITTRRPLSQRYSSILSLRSHHRTSRAVTPPAAAAADSPRQEETFDWEPTEQMIEAQFQTQRARLASIMSICTVEGVEGCEGLKIAYSRCLQSVSQLLYQEKVLEDTILRSAQAFFASPPPPPPPPPSASWQPGAQRLSVQDCSNATNSRHHLSERRPSLFEIAL